MQYYFAVDKILVMELYYIQLGAHTLLINKIIIRKYLHKEIHFLKEV